MKKCFLYLILFFCPLLASTQTDDIARKKIMVDSLLKLADAYNNSKDSKKVDSALVVLNLVKPIVEGSFEKNSEENCRLLEEFGIYYVKKTQFLNAEKYFDAIFEIANKKWDKGNNKYFDLLNNVGYVKQKVGKYKDGILYLEKSLSLIKEKYGKIDTAYLDPLNNLAVTYRKMGYEVKAEPLYYEYLKICELTKGKLCLSYAIGLNNLGVFYNNQEKYKLAKYYYLESLNIREQLYPKGSIESAKILHNLAVVLSNMGNDTESELYFQKALEMRGKLLPNTHLDYINTVIHFAEFYMDRGNIEKAEQILSATSLDIIEKSAGKNSADYMYCSFKIIKLLYYKKKYKEVETLIRQDLIYVEKLRSKNHTDYAERLILLCKVLVRQGKMEMAEQYYKEVLSIYTTSPNKLFSKYNSGILDLCFFYTDSDDENKIIKSIKIKQENILNLVQYSSEKGVENNVNTHFKQDKLLNRIYTTNLKSAKILSALYEENMFYKGFLMNDLMRIKKVAQQDTSLGKIYDELRNCRRHLSAEFTKPKSKRDTILIDDWTTRTEDAEKKLARLMPDYKNTYHVATCREIQQKLKPNEVAIEFLNFTRNDSTFYIALMMTAKDSVPIYINLFDETTFRKEFRKFDAKITSINNMYSSKTDNTFRKMITQPIENQLNKNQISTVYFAPTGVVHNFNLAALSSNVGITWVRLNSTRDILFKSLADVSFAKKSENNTAQVFGGIVYDLDSTKFEKVNSKPSATDEMVTRSSNLNRKECWKYLNGAAKEGQIVSDTLESANYKMTYQTGYSASEENFKQIGKNEISPRILHVGSHAFTFPNPFQKQNIASDFLDEELQFKTADDPMLRTGLVFAGANYFCKYGVPYRNYEDGIATAYEIRDMNLAQTELAVLSACETGLGDIHNSEGVYGLQRAFRIAGVQFIIVSLWKIPDESAKDFMRFFYGNWVANDTMSLREAFRQAREKTKALHPDPNDWAGFILIE